MLKVKEVHKSYKAHILKGISVAIDRGEIIAIAGQNGSGKSTLLSIITSIIKPDSGTVTINGQDIFKNRQLVREHIGYVPQENCLFENLTVLDNLKFWASAYKKDYKKIIYNEDVLNKKVKVLSGGMKKRLSIVISLINEPNYLIMDEPTSSLDIKCKMEVIDTIVSMKNSGKSIIFTSHQLDELLLSDKLLVIKNGVFVYSGEPQKLDKDFKKMLLSLMC
jgi:ABC-2 type transport system ATP-binding protein